jgi:hypothetical protein
MTNILTSWCRSGIQAHPRVRLMVGFLAMAALVLLPQLALAYPGEQMVNWARGSIVAPLCFFAIVISIVVSLVRPQLAVVAVWVTVISLFLMYVMSNGATITGQLQSSN